MSIIGSDNREIITSFKFPYSTVTAVDILVVSFDRKAQLYNVFPSIGSGITIAPNHVLTAGHNAFNEENDSAEPENINLGLRTTVSANQGNLETRELEGVDDRGNPDPSTNGSNVTNVNYLAGFNNTPSPRNDIALFTTSNASIEAEGVIGLIAFVDATTAKNFTIKTAGYPGDNVDARLSNYTEEGRDLVRAPKGENSTGTIIEALPNGRFYYSENIDTYPGQSGSGIWHTIDSYDPPRVLGVHTAGSNETVSGEDINSFNNGRLITKDIYDKIVEQIKKDSGTKNADQLPENAIIGSETANEIIGTYRRERIIGKGGNDVLDGMEADDRLEGGSGDDVLNGGVGEDLAVFTGSFADYDFTLSADKKTITVDHARGTQADDTDTLRNIEFAQFQDTLEGAGNLNIFPEPEDESGNQNIFPEGEPSTVTRIVPFTPG